MSMESAWQHHTFRYVAENFRAGDVMLVFTVSGEFRVEIHFLKTKYWLIVGWQVGFEVGKLDSRLASWIQGWQKKVYRCE